MNSYAIPTPGGQAITPEKPRSIPLALGFLDEKISTLEGEVSRLYQKLQPVVAPAPESPKPIDTKDPSAVVLANEIRHHGQRLADVAIRVRFLIDNIEL